MKKITFSRRVCLTAIVAALALPTIYAGNALYAFYVLTSPSVYGEKDITIKEVKAEKDGKVKITFTAPLESIYYCPGANAKTTEKGIELTFVRSYMKKKPKVTYPATSVRKPNEPVEKVITVTANGKAIFLRDGEKLIQLYPVPTTQAATQAQDALFEGHPDQPRSN